MSMDNKVPEIRFKGFSGAWIQENISNIAPLQRGFDLPKNLIKVGAHPVVMSNGVNGFHNAFKAKAPGVVTGRSGTIGNIHYIDVDYWPHNTSLWVTNFHKNVPLFIYYLYVKLDLKRFGTGSGVPTLNRNDVHVQSVALPKDSKEQTAIGNYFQKLDTLINQHQQKHDKLSNIKKAMLEKMFPKPGETIPEIRFKGFSGEWVENNLGELIDIRSAARVHKEQWTEAGVPFFRTSDVVSIYKGQENTKAYISHEIYHGLSEKIGKVTKDDLLITGGGSIGIPYLVPNDSPLYFKDADLLWLKNNEKFNGYFLYTFFFSVSFKQHIKSISHTGTIAHYTIEQAKATPINACSDEEQTTIGNYFQKLDALINQHQQQISKLNNIKQACLSKMFI
ncbi:type I restriction enzyme%2C S subunit [Yersinia aldovae]|uniref:restriction endonuclease subunit S n=1 Tax=Yersinia aldovae TaxID=29483 RepID=UPI0005E2B0EF|nr:restriction endonuclease subunit S [Yersinia aldovae]CNJ12039.1 type I restriction enzyme%2C S subunit [Yersinia aldovae]